MPQVAIVTCRDLPLLTQDDRLLLPALQRLGIEAVPAVWSDPGIPWQEFDAAILRSTWDYTSRHAEFLEWVERTAGKTALWNPSRVLRWNSHKSYLKELESRDLPVIPTVVLDSPTSARQVMDREGWDRAVLKPAVSNGGHRTYLLDARDRDPEPTRYADLEDGGRALLQPYMDAVEGDGEHSLVFLGGRYSHAFLRAPKLITGSPLSEGVALRATDPELDLARRTLRAIPGDLLYGRVDLVRDLAGSPRIMEVELIEPALYLGISPPAAEIFAGAIRSRL